LHVKLERRLVQLIILVLARFASAQFAWFIHELHAREHGIAPARLSYSRTATPNFPRADQGSSMT
jgi:hypothetical protein